MTRYVFPRLDTSSSLYFCQQGITLWRHCANLVSQFAYLSKINRNSKASKIWDFRWSATYILSSMVLNHTVKFRAITRNKNYRDGQPSVFDICNLQNIQRDSIAGTLTRLRTFLCSNPCGSHIVLSFKKSPDRVWGPVGTGFSSRGK